MRDVQQLIDFKKNLAQTWFECHYRGAFYPFHEACSGPLCGIKIDSTFILCEKHARAFTAYIIDELTEQDLFTLRIL